MYRGFNVKDLTFDCDIEELAKQYDHNHINTFKIQVFSSVEQFIKNEYTFDGNALIKEWFPHYENYDIFISHSHSDINLAKALATWLKQSFGLISFIDSTVWGNFAELRQRIHNFYIKELGVKYDFEQQDRVSQHVMMMLNTSLMEMMDRCQCLFFLNTPNSISVNDVMKDSTYSPWIFSEIGMFNCIKKRIPLSLLLQKRNLQEDFSQVSYKLDLSKLTDLEADDLKEWESECWNNRISRQECLNKLYELHPLNGARFNYL